MAQKRKVATRPSKTPARPAGKTAAIAAPKDSLVVYVHGVGGHPAHDELRLQWDLALFGRDLGDRSRMAYWADLAPSAAASKASARRRKAVDDETLDLDDVLGRAGVSTAQRKVREFSLALLAELGIAEAASGSGVAKKILPLPAFMRKPISRFFIEAVRSPTRRRTSSRPACGKDPRPRLAEIDRVGSRPVTIVAHSHGSIIAYEVSPR